MPRSTPHELSRRRLLSLSASATLLAACGTDPEPAAREVRESAAPGPLALVGLRLPGGDGAPVAVTVEGALIAEVGEAAPDGVQVRDLDGGWVVPGFLDSHVHMQFADPAAVLAGGVTTVRDLGGPASAAQALRGQGELRVLIAGRILTAVGGYPTRSWGADGTGREIADAEDAVAAVAEQVAAGAVVLKVALEDGGGAPVLDLGTLQAIIATGAEAGLRTTAHVGSAAMLELALEAGVDELCHLPLHAVTAAEMVRVAQAGVVLVPTLEIRGQDPAAALAVRAFREAGGEVWYGSDLGNGGTAPGIEVTEVRAMLAAGMSPAEVLRAATEVPAAGLGLDVGRLQAGAAADLVVLGADPFADPSAYDDVRLVMAGGQPR